MDRSWIFLTKAGNIGIAREKDNNLLVYIEKNMFSRSFQVSIWSVLDELMDERREEISIESLNMHLRNNDIAEEEVILLEKAPYPGNYYPRIARENIHFNYVSNDFKQDARAYQNIQSSLDHLFNYIEPAEENLKAYGHKIRELLIITCTEVEYLLQKMLTENGYSKENNRYTTKDYFKCKNVLKLNEYGVRLYHNLDLKLFKPFENWNFENSTESLPWYNAYNSVKHNRGDNIAQANLEHLLDAVSALHILLESQYGKNIFIKLYSYTEDRSVFNTIERPTWEPHEITVPLLKQVYEVKTEWLGKRKYFEDFSA
ncbi:hypothetical protein KMZ14_06440 [Acinetobacter schindleri]|uniref:hypothetical protein n=1 Tax=Acinetobacter schindleri TaxID=108981 RepID=UPI00235F50FE|nr:hypothetical protein [Acinetobacter schindleri]WDE17164.1 hypothetical protein KMZ14_06440 [Acinetobacter schindleri]